MPVILGYFFAKFTLGFIKKTIYVALLVIFFGSLFAMWASFIIAFLYFFTAIQNTLDMISVGSDGIAVAKFYGLLNCIGFVDAFNGTKSVWLSGLTFIITRILMVATTKIYKTFIVAIAPLILE